MDNINRLLTFAIIFLVAFYGALIIGPGVDAKSLHNSAHILVKIRDGHDKVAANKDLQNAGGKIDKHIAEIDVLIVKVPAGKEAQIVERLSKNPKFEYAELDYFGSASINDPLFANQWGLDNRGQEIKGLAGLNDADIDAPEAWATTTGQNIRVAVLDSGVDQDHEDISSKLVLQRNFSTSNTVDDIYGHGTHVAGIIAATTENSVGVGGACPGCNILNGKVLRDDGYGASSWVSSGITWATDNGAKVINMSLGFTSKSKTLERAVNYAWNNGVVIVASAGNGGNQAKEYPGAYTNVIAVAATNNNDAKASFSTYGARWVDIAAPGENVFSTFPNHSFTIQTKYGRSQNYDYANGTSMAAPMVAGTAALVWSLPEYTTAPAVRNRLESTADKISGTGTYWSAGRVNAAKAVAR